MSSTPAAAKGAPTPTRAAPGAKLVRRRTMPEITAPPPAARRANQLMKSQSWSPGWQREEVWQRKKRMQKYRRSNSLSFDDLDEFKACYELGFRFDSPDSIKLSPTFPALNLYHIVKKQYESAAAGKSLSRSSSSASSPEATEPGLNLFLKGRFPGLNLFLKGEEPKMMKDRIKLWAQVVGCMMKEAITE